MISSKVSVIIPVYNAEKYLSRCLNSILAQTFRDLEVVIVNDGSTDSSLQLAQSYQRKDSRIKVFDVPNSGVSAARNIGINRSQGDWVLFVDADDWIDKNTIDVLLQLQKRTAVDIVAYSFCFELKNHNKIIGFDQRCFQISELLEGKVIEKYPDSLLCSVCNKLYERDKIVKNHIRFNKSLRYGEDFEFNSKYFLYSPLIATTGEVYYHYDCLVENSGVKKIYSNYDEFITSMDNAFFHLSDNLKCDSSLVNPFRIKFISERWLYAINVLLDANISYREKTELLLKWYKNIPDDIKAYLITIRTYYNIFSILEIKSTLIRICRLNFFLRKNHIAKQIMSLKSKLKKLLLNENICLNTNV